MKKKVKRPPKKAVGHSVSSKGQVTVPKSVRYALNLRSGDRVTFVADGDRAIMQPVRSDFFALRGCLRKYAKHGMTRAQERDAAKRYVSQRYWSHRHGSP